MVEILKKFIDLFVAPFNFMFKIFLPLSNSGGGVRTTSTDSYISVGQIFCYLVILVSSLITLKTFLNYRRKDVD